ncbi:MAG: DUF2953 domain-containing protein [Oscillospiraceae bacterium]|nr:DUF2953 domain-containing protein [Oscillospiraceae bacterium]
MTRLPIVIKILLLLVLVPLGLALALVVVLLLLAILLLLAPVRIGAVGQYSKAGLQAWSKVGPVRIRVFPRPPSEKPKKEPKDKPEEEPEDKDKSEEGGTVEQLKAVLSEIGPILGQVRRRLVFSEIILHYTASAEDAAVTALAYGGAHVAVNHILSMIRHGFQVKRQDVQIHANFNGEGDTVFLRVGLRISVWGAICLGIFVFRRLRKAGVIKLPKLRKN